MSNASNPRQSLELDAESIEFISALPPDQKSKTLHVVGANIESERLSKGLRGSIDFWNQYGVELNFMNCDMTANVGLMWTLDDLEKLILESFEFDASHKSANHFLFFLNKFKDPRILGLSPVCPARNRPHIAIFERGFFPSPILLQVLNHEIGHLLGLVHCRNPNCLMSSFRSTNLTPVHET